MPQVKKEQVSRRISSAARKEFLRKGFNDASLRNIASASGVSLSNLYSYHENKDSLFCSVVSEVKQDFDFIADFFNNYRPDGSDFDSLQTEVERARGIAPYIRQRRIELQLILNKSMGSSLEDFSEQVVAGYVRNCRNLVDHVHSKNRVKYVPTDFFFSSIARMGISALKEITREKKSEEEIADRAEELARYNYFGFRGLAGYPLTNEQGESDEYI